MYKIFTSSLQNSLALPEQKNICTETMVLNEMSSTWFNVLCLKYSYIMHWSKVILRSTPRFSESFLKILFLSFNKSVYKFKSRHCFEDCS